LDRISRTWNRGEYTHYNPVIDKAVQELFNIPENYVLVAQMPFGGIVAEREAKAEEDISKRVRFIK